MSTGGAVDTDVHTSRKIPVEEVGIVKLVEFKVMDEFTQTLAVGV